MKKWIEGAAEGRGSYSQRRVRESGAYTGTHKEKRSPKPLA